MSKSELQRQLIEAQAAVGEFTSSLSEIVGCLVTSVHRSGIDSHRTGLVSRSYVERALSLLAGSRHAQDLLKTLDLLQEEHRAGEFHAHDACYHGNSDEVPCAQCQRYYEAWKRVEDLYT